MLVSTMRAPRFSIITVVYNDVVGLSSTYASVALQKFRDFEWVVIDGGSTDGTKDFLDELSNCEYATWISERDSGIYDAMNKGIKRSNGEYLVFLNAGDLLTSSNVLGSVSEKMHEDHEPDVLFGGADLSLTNEKYVYRPPKTMDLYIWHGLPANHQATYYKRATLGDLLYDTTYKICGDYYIIARLFVRGVRAAYLDKSLVKFDVGGASYRNHLPLFLEPYRIQRDILGKSLFVRLASFVKRLFSTVAITILKTVYPK